MPKALESLLGCPRGVWERFHGFLENCAERHIVAWLWALQYKRRYTNPDLIEKYRQKR